jgi:uncharacterized protein
MQSAALCFSGGTDSSLLLLALRESGIRCLAVTAFSDLMSEKELRDAEQTAHHIGIPHAVIKTNELANPSFAENTVERCFHCKDSRLSVISALADAERYAVVIEGSNCDDLKQWRPGMKAVSKHRVRSPLIEASLTKSEIRDLSRIKGLRTWSKPSSPCLATRFPYGTTITREALLRVAQAEEHLRTQGFTEFRVRDHQAIARIELRENEIGKLMQSGIKESVTHRLKELGFRYVTVDLEGFRSGSFDQP